jgi:2-C-methyl-D-erythritol 4-phosphate cytidylyltransferase
MENFKKTVIILAGGKGLRMNAPVPKQFLLLAGQPVLMHSIARFYNYDRAIKIVVVLPFDHIETWNRLLSEHRFFIPHQIVPGGDERFFSVQNAINATGDEGIIALHDGVRPLVSERVISNCFRSAATMGSAVPAISPTESVRIIKDNRPLPFDRRNTLLIQTPQVFRADLIKKAYQTDYLPHFTDDATVYEADNNKVNIVEGNPENIKITCPADLIFATALLQSEKIQEKS